MRYSDPGTPVNGYYACLVGLLGWLSTVFGYLFCLTIGLYGVHCSTLLRRSLFYFIFFPFFFCFCSFNFSLRVSFHSIQPLCAPGYVRPQLHTYKPCTYHYDCCTLSLLMVQGIKQAHAETKWRTHATTELFRGFGTLVQPRPNPSRTWAIQTEPGHVEVYN